MHRKAAVIACAALALAGCGGSKPGRGDHADLDGGGHEDGDGDGPPTAVVPKTVMETDGIYRVGVDIEPGTYRTAGKSAEGATDCHWARLSSLNEVDYPRQQHHHGSTDGSDRGGDRAFLTHSCQTWMKLG